MEVLVIGIATAFNFVIIMWKFSNNRPEDAVLDFGIFAAISYMFSGTISGMSVGMVASAIISVWLLFNPISIEEEESHD